MHALNFRIFGLKQYVSGKIALNFLLYRRVKEIEITVEPLKRYAPKSHQL